ncbi:hypothetical protein MVEN_01295000 [Mycena venus]|uniref:Uncharacterized protein n=1 Tax=Mycena venus TaxID=2733690 RepID=A0A8H6Y169_9AGAR|nr:hypothetical protein MVEN_01295000 [Mycena venus]
MGSSLGPNQIIASAGSNVAPIQVSLHYYTMVDEYGKERKQRKVYQLTAQNIRVLAESDKFVEPHDQPVPPTGSCVVASLPTRALASFANFVVPSLDIAAGPSSSNSSASAHDTACGTPRLSPPNSSESGSSTASFITDADEMMGIEEDSPSSSSSAAKGKKVSKRAKTSKE